jgi:asparagine synthase (glutamine-hydrolysing)
MFQQWLEHQHASSIPLFTSPAADLAGMES